MRLSIAGLGSISFLVVGVFAIGYIADKTYTPAVVNGTNRTAEAWNASEAVLGGVVQGGGQLLVWAGVAGVIIGALWLLVSAGGSR